MNERIRTLFLQSTTLKALVTVAVVSVIRIQTDASLLGPAQSLFNGLKQLNTNISRSDSYTFIQEDVKRPGVFLALYGNHLVEISDGKLAFLTQKNTHFFLAPFSFLQQSNSSKIIVADNELKRLLSAERGKWDVSVHSGLCVADDSPDPVDGSFSECLYSGPYDIQTHPENIRISQHGSQVQIKLGWWSKYASDTVTAFDSITFISEDILLVTVEQWLGVSALAILRLKTDSLVHWNPQNHIYDILTLYEFCPNIDDMPFSFNRSSPWYSANIERLCLRMNDGLYMSLQNGKLYIAGTPSMEDLTMTHTTTYTGIDVYDVRDYCSIRWSAERYKLNSIVQANISSNMKNLTCLSNIDSALDWIDYSTGESFVLQRDNDTGLIYESDYPISPWSPVVEEQSITPKTIERTTSQNDVYVSPNTSEANETLSDNSLSTTYSTITSNAPKDGEHETTPPTNSTLVYDEADVNLTINNSPTRANRSAVIVIASSVTAAVVLIVGTAALIMFCMKQRKEASAKRSRAVAFNMNRQLPVPTANNPDEGSDYEYLDDGYDIVNESADADAYTEIQDEITSINDTSNEASIGSHENRGSLNNARTGVLGSISSVHNNLDNGYATPKDESTEGAYVLGQIDCVE